jgi:glycolate oxidase iron-sulfur subunit
MDLGLDADELAACVSCGLCLSHCPTFRVTGEEAFSPRGRIDAMRSVHIGGADPDDEFHELIATCVQCRGCEPACPSGVRFGHLMESTRTALVSHADEPRRLERIGYWVLRHHRVLGVGSRLLAGAQRLRLIPRRVGLPRIPIRQPAQVSSTAQPGHEEAWLFTGCVMDAWMRATHLATARVLDVLGVRYGVSGGQAGCCGALHLHAGLHDQAAEMARQVIGAIGEHGEVVVNSAGCGAMMKEYGDMIADAEPFAQRVRDVNEFIAARLGQLPEPKRTLGPVIVQDPCHLRHVQRSHAAVRAVIGHIADIVELADDGLCCGAGGAYAAQQPEMAGAIRDRKIDVIATAAERTGATTVVSSNPGCLGHLHGPLSALGLSIRHPIDLLAESVL